MAQIQLNFTDAQKNKIVEAGKAGWPHIFGAESGNTDSQGIEKVIKAQILPQVIKHYQKAVSNDAVDAKQVLVTEAVSTLNIAKAEKKTAMKTAETQMQTDFSDVISDVSGV